MAGGQHINKEYKIEENEEIDQEVVCKLNKSEKRFERTPIITKTLVDKKGTQDGSSKVIKLTKD